MALRPLTVRPSLSEIYPQRRGPFRSRRRRRTLHYGSARRRVGTLLLERIIVNWLWIVIIVIVVLAILGYRYRGRLSR